MHHTIDTYSGIQWTTALASEKADFVIMHLLEVMAIIGIPIQIKMNNGLECVPNKMKQFFTYYNIKCVTDIPHKHTGQVIVERSNSTFQKMLNRQMGTRKNPRNRLHSALLALSFLNMLMNKNLWLLEYIGLWEKNNLLPVRFAYRRVEEEKDSLYKIHTLGC